MSSCEIKKTDQWISHFTPHTQEMLLNKVRPLDPVAVLLSQTNLASKKRYSEFPKNEFPRLDVCGSTQPLPRAPTDQHKVGYNKNNPQILVLYQQHSITAMISHVKKNVSKKNTLLRLFGFQFHHWFCLLTGGFENATGPLDCQLRRDLG